ncbi:chromate transporter [bacterium]|nr:chromate transporter [bacterium]
MDMYCIFKRFFKIGALLLGGGYVILPLLKAEIADKFDEIAEDDICEYYAISQCMPGIIAINTAGLVGHKLMGTKGAICAVTALILPAFTAIILLASFLTNIANLTIVQKAFAGIGIGVLALVFQAINEMREKSIVDKYSLIVFLCAFICLFGLKISPAFVIIAGIIFGIITGFYKAKAGKK